MELCRSKVGKNFGFVSFFGFVSVGRFEHGKSGFRTAIGPVGVIVDE